MKLKLVDGEWGECETEDPDGVYIDANLWNKVQKIWQLQRRNWDAAFLIDGMEGCLSGDTMINVSRAELGRRYNLKYMYNQYNGNPDNLKRFKQWDLKILTRVRSYNGKEIRLHKISNVVYSGKKMIYKLRLENGLLIKATANHKFISRNGWKELKDLKVGEEIMCDKPRSSTNGRRRIKLYDILLRVPYHKYGKNRIEVHRLIYEARLNNMKFTEYIDILLNESDKSKQLKYIDMNKYIIHHIDGCHYNNSIDNLKLMDRMDHFKYHGSSSYEKFSQGIPQWFKIEDIVEKDIEDTYDIQCEEPHHNFVANGIVVHNSGKSTLGQTLAWILSKGKLTINNFARNGSDALERLKTMPDGSILFIDEASILFSATDHAQQEQRQLIKVMQVVRQKRMIFILICPSFFKLNQYIAVSRTRFLVHVYAKGFERGRFTYFSEKKKKILYPEGKKRFGSYRNPHCDFIGTFSDFKLPFEEEYQSFKKDTMDKLLNSEIIKRKITKPHANAVRKHFKEHILNKIEIMFADDPIKKTKLKELLTNPNTVPEFDPDKPI